jgi:hypothetical protein
MRSAGSILVMLALAGIPQEALADESESNDVLQRMNTRARERYESGDLVGAAVTYGAMLDRLPENAVNREERDNLVLIALAVYVEAYEKTRDAELLHYALVVFESYEAQYHRVYDGQSISAYAVEAGRMIRELQVEAEPPVPPPIVERDPEIIVCGYGPKRARPILLGSLALVAAAGSSAMIVVGAHMGSETRTGNALVIAGSISTAAFAIAGATLLGIGVRRRLEYLGLAISPAQVGRSRRARV